MNTMNENYRLLAQSFIADYMLSQQYTFATSNIDDLAAAARMDVSDHISRSVQILQREIAEQIYAGGRKPTFSSNICDELTCGYGKLSDWGDWQFPLIPAAAYAHNVSDLRDKD